jgi:hypothetical protein
MLPAQLLPPNIAPGLSSQRHLVNVLSSHGYFLPHPSVIETHISWVLLSGHDAYKIKKAVDLGFLDFSSLKARNYYCDEDLRLNRRLAPDIYISVVPIGGTPEEPVLGRLPAIEYAVHMRRFSPSGLKDRMSAHALITPDHIDKLASIIAGFHNS